MTGKETRPGEGEVTYEPGARDELDRGMLSEEEAFEDQHPGATAETFEAQTSKDRGQYPGSPSKEERDKMRVRGSALPSEQGRRD